MLAEAVSKLDYYLNSDFYCKPGQMYGDPEFLKRVRDLRDAMRNMQGELDAPWLSEDERKAIIKAERNAVKAAAGS